MKEEPEMTAQKTHSILDTLCRTRVQIANDNSTIINLNLLCALVALLVAPWLVIGGAIVALALGCKLDVVRPGEQQAAASIRF